MKSKLFRISLFTLFLFGIQFCQSFIYSKNTTTVSDINSGFTNADAFGFSPDSTGLQNSKALQKALNMGGTIVVSKPGTYKIAATVFISSNTKLIFGTNVYLKKNAENGAFTHVILNKGALTKTFDQNIIIEGLNIVVNGVDKAMSEVYGLRGQLAFFYAKDVRIERFRCMDLMKAQFGIHVCTFEDLIIDDVIIKGEKDGVHLGRGKRFAIRNGVFQTFDDAIALNAHDYATSNPELGWIEDGVIENCHDLDAENTTGFFCRILSGAWTDWKPDMDVQQSDAVVSNGRVYRVQAQPDGTVYKSITKPDHEKGSKVLDGIKWGVVQNDVTYTAGVRNVVFRDIFLHKQRIAFSIHFDNDKYSRSYYPGAPVPVQEQLLFDNIRVMHNGLFLRVNTPIDAISVINSSFGSGGFTFEGNGAMQDYGKSRIHITGCFFRQQGNMTLVKNNVKNKEIILNTASNIILSDSFSAKAMPGEGKIIIESELTGLKQQ